MCLPDTGYLGIFSFPVLTRKGEIPRVVEKAGAQSKRANSRELCQTQVRTLQTQFVNIGKKKTYQKQLKKN